MNEPLLQWAADLEKAMGPAGDLALMAVRVDCLSNLLMLALGIALAAGVWRLRRVPGELEKQDEPSNLTLVLVVLGMLVAGITALVLMVRGLIMLPWSLIGLFWPDVYLAHQALEQLL